MRYLVGRINMSINLLPWRASEQLDYRKYCVLIFSIITLFSYLLSYGIYFYLHEKNIFLEKQILQMKNTIAHIPIDKIQADQALLKKLHILLENQKTSVIENTSIKNNLALLANQTDDRITLQTLDFSEKNAVLHGEGTSLNEIHHYVEALQASLNTWQVALSDIHNDSQGKPIFYFAITLSHLTEKK